ncbi:MAG TPA: ArsC/Spx/MgsR family protein [Rhizomicrobium sp.]|nr:ArsC/Spx/MgsR family protein [Rhizomicrobium sp.]
MGHEPHLVDVITAPPSREELKTLSLLMREADQSLVRRYDRLFLELQLDDRFISENEFWTGIFEHPTLINGPVLASANKARLCRTPQDVKAFLGADAAAGKPKGLSPRIAAMMTGGVVPPPTPKEHIAPAISQKPAPAVLAKQGEPKAKIETRKTAKPAAAKPALKKAAAKPVKKAAPAKKPVKMKK